MNKHKIITVGLLLLIIVSSACAFVGFSDDYKGDSIPMATINASNGSTFKWDVETNLDTAVLVSANPSIIPSDGYSTVSGWARVDGKTVIVEFPDELHTDKYYVSVKAVSSQPTQELYYTLAFDLKTYSVMHPTDWNVNGTANLTQYVIPGETIPEDLKLDRIETVIKYRGETVEFGTNDSYFVNNGNQWNGLIWDDETGAISGTCPEAGKVEITQKFVISSETGGKTYERTVVIDSTQYGNSSSTMTMFMGGAALVGIVFIFIVVAKFRNHGE